jgi:signal transduction histidine kinase
MKKKRAVECYEPIVTISSKRINGKVEIVVKDNSTSIPHHIIDKVFHPSFTTKPTGIVTGLGLFPNYDILKACGCELKVQSMEGEGATFIVLLSVV